MLSYKLFNKLLSSILTILLLSTMIAGLTGCEYQKKYEQSNYSMGTRSKQEQHESRAYGYMHQGGNHHDNQAMSYDIDTGTEVMRLPGIAAAHAIMTDKNAYVAIVLDDTARGTLQNRDPRDVNNVGKSDGNFDATARGRLPNYRHKLVSDRNSKYTLPSEADISSKLKQEVALKVRSLHPGVQEVFVSANRDFVNQCTVYAQDYYKRRSLQRHLLSFNELLHAYFPSAKTN